MCKSTADGAVIHVTPDQFLDHSINKIYKIWQNTTNAFCLYANVTMLMLPYVTVGSNCLIQL